MELIKKRNDITPNVKNNSPRKAYKNTVTPGSVTISQSIDTSPEKNIDTPARVNRSRSKDMSPEENTDTPAIVTRSRSKDLSPESNSNEPKVKSKDTISIRKEIIPGIKNTKSKIFQMADTDSIPNKEIPELDKYKKKAKADEDGCIIQLPEDIPRNRKPQFSSTTPIHIGDVDMIEKYLPIHGRTKRVLWNKQDPTVGKSFRGTSLTISVGSISSIDSMTTVFHETDENFDYKVNNKSPNAKEHADKSSHDLHATTGDKNRIKSVERTQMSLPDVNCTTIDERHSESNENSETSLPDLNSISPNIGNMAARKKIQMTLPASSSHSKASKNNIKAKTKTKMGLPDLNSTTVEHFHNKNNMTLNEKTGINLTEFTSLDKSRKDNENIAMSLPDLNFSMVGLSKEISLPDLNLTTTDCNKNMPTKRLAKTPTNTKVPAKKYKSASTTVQAVHCRDINTPDRNKTRTRLVSSDKSLEMSNLDAVEGMVRVTRSSKVSSENKISNNEVFDKSKSNLTLTPILKKPEKRQQKQIHRKSKFKKMGIVEIADLDTDRTA
ncbi:uncharacterized protein LOC113239755 [Hyposmocoma kahamanoa]|uniref:uncharacterized protein LOC113239755 n=1 Tax=Hyposmocoma kahamanoa TaxID=1477025 RepID=UPI000E6D7ED5|nr:uncharacterized protein LOC113239755 [Hyposmocoma kahamanoa]